MFHIKGIEMLTTKHLMLLDWKGKKDGIKDKSGAIKKNGVQILKYYINSTFTKIENCTVVM